MNAPEPLELAPLRGLAAAAGRDVPEFWRLSPEQIPEPQNRLLVHMRDMTRTLEQYHRGKIYLRVLTSKREGAIYWRESALEIAGSGQVVEYGAIQIFLDRFEEPWRTQILGEHLPLGGILNQSGVSYSSYPSGYFGCNPDPFIRRALRLEPTFLGPLYGRENTLRGADGIPLAHIVEILPPTK